MANLSFNAWPYNIEEYNAELVTIVIIDRPAQVASAGRPVTHMAEHDPVMVLRPEGASLRALEETRRALENMLRD